MPRFSCPNCEKSLKVSAAVPAGKKIKCPACGDIFRLSAEVVEEEAIQVEAPARSAKAVAASKATSERRRADPDDDEETPPPSVRKSKRDDDADPDSEDRPARRRSKKKAASKNNLPLILGGAGAVVVLLGVAGFVWPGFLVGSSNKPKSGGTAQRQAPPSSGAVAENSRAPKGPETLETPPRKEPASDGVADVTPDPKAAKTDGPAEIPSPTPGKDPGSTADAGPKDGGAAGRVSASVTIREAMIKIGRGPKALNGRISKELMKDEPAWDALQGQTAEYAAMATAMASQDPPRGSKDSWAKLSASFADSAANLDRSAQAKDRGTALVAYKSLENACMVCHQQHRGGSGGFGPGGPGGGFGGKGAFGPKSGFKGGFKGGKGKKGPPPMPDN